MKSAAVDTKRTTKIQDTTKSVDSNLTIVEPPSAEMVFLKPGSRAWAEAWKGLLHLAGCVVARDTETGEHWEYVGTYQGYHEFRHRAHPGAGGQRLYARVPTSCGAGDTGDTTLQCCKKRGGRVWAGSPYPDDKDHVQLRKDCPLKAFFRADDG